MKRHSQGPRDSSHHQILDLVENGSSAQTLHQQQQQLEPPAKMQREANILPLHKCEICNLNFQNFKNENIIYHKPKHSLKFDCYHCKKPFLNNDERFIHLQTGCDSRNKIFSGGSTDNIGKIENFENLWDVKLNENQQSSKYKTEIKKYTVNLNKKALFTIDFSNLNFLLTDVLNKLVGEVSENTLIHITIDSHEVDYGMEYTAVYKKDLENHILEIIQHVQNVSQSHRAFNISEGFKIMISLTQVPTSNFVGNGRKKIGQYTNLENCIKYKTSIISVDGPGCFVKSILIAIEKIKNPSKFHIFNTNKNKNNKFINDVIEVYEMLDIPYDSKIGKGEWEIFQSYYKDYQLVIFTLNEEIIFKGDVVFNSVGKENVIYLLLDPFEEHYYPIVNITGFLGVSYYCEICQCKYSRKLHHVCKNECYLCREIHKVDIEEEIDENENYCDICNITFYSDYCFGNHKNNNICQKIQKCEKCNRRMFFGPSEERHHCPTKCEICERLICSRNKHSCYFEPIEINDCQVEKIIFFDIESYIIEENLSNLKQTLNPKKHVPNLLISHTVTRKLNFENPIKNVFWGETCIEEFCEFLYENPKSIIMAHNAGGYDSTFILKWLLANGKKFQYLPRGSKYIYVELSDLNSTILDSLNFFPVALKKLSSMFSVDTIKGYFPHKFNSKDNLNYNGKWPEKIFYDTGNFKKK